MASPPAAPTLVERLREAWDRRATPRRFTGASFEGVTFEDPVDLSGACFRDVSFRGATFKKSVDFRGAEFHGEVRFDCATFEGSAYFADVDFYDRVRFDREHRAREDPLDWPEEVSFKGWADFTGARFHARAGFAGARFEGRAMFKDAEFAGDASFVGARFCEARTFGPFDVAGRLELDRASFEAPVRIQAGARRVMLRRTQFLARTTLELSWAHVVLDDAEFAQPSVLAGPSGISAPIGAGHGRETARPSIRSMRHANVGNLTLADVDLSTCRFAGAHRLDGLRLDGRIPFARKPKRTFTRRRAIVEELDLRERAETKHVTADRVARTYRALRKGREDNKDEPGAADFYYGEMEMRRLDARGFERRILGLYRAVSGYGIRASRALACLVITVVAATLALRAWGFDSDQGLWDSLLFSFESTSSLFRGPTVIEASELNTWGHAFQICLRLLGPLFFGLALLALRGRVKR
jgi:uncharacterized protein YjbI with pentapeptide repeats